MSDERERHWHGWCPKCQSGKRTDLDEGRCWTCGTQMESVTEHEGELVEVEVERPPKMLTATYAIRLPKEAVDELRVRANRENTKPTALARSFILQGLRRE